MTTSQKAYKDSLDKAAIRQGRIKHFIGVENLQYNEIKDFITDFFKNHKEKEEIKKQIAEAEIKDVLDYFCVYLNRQNTAAIVQFLNDFISKQINLNKGINKAEVLDFIISDLLSLRPRLEEERAKNFFTTNAGKWSQNFQLPEFDSISSVFERNYFLRYIHYNEASFVKGYFDILTFEEQRASNLTERIKNINDSIEALTSKKRDCIGEGKHFQNKEELQDFLLSLEKNKAYFENVLQGTEILKV